MRTLIGFVLVALMLTGCATVRTGEPLPLANQFERGDPNVVVDVAGNVLSIPSKLLMWNRRVDNHDISPNTEDAIRHYVAVNGLDSTKVRLNQYDPIGEWKRLGRNKAMPTLLRYTAGTLQTIGYTIMPGRLFGGDEYNPYTDTLNVYSDLPTLGMVEAAYAKELRMRKHRGWYAFGQEMPIIGMHHEGLATDDVIDYLSVHANDYAVAEGYELLYPRYGGAWGETIGDLFMDNPIGEVAGTIVGHVAGRIKSSDYKLDNSVVPTEATVRAQTPSE